MERERDMPVSRAFFYTFHDKKNLTFLSKPPVKERCHVSRASGSLIYISHEIGGKHTVTDHRAPCGQAYIQWGVAWFTKGIVCDTAISTPVPCTL
jgi:hypothetical protein